MRQNYELTPDEKKAAELLVRRDARRMAVDLYGLPMEEAEKWGLAEPSWMDEEFQEACFDAYVDKLIKGINPWDGHHADL